jgi:cell division septal protein FtsQ
VPVGIEVVERQWPYGIEVNMTEGEIIAPLEVAQSRRLVYLEGDWGKLFVMSRRRACWEGKENGRSAEV